MSNLRDQIVTMDQPAYSPSFLTDLTLAQNVSHRKPSLMMQVHVLTQQFDDWSSTELCSHYESV